MASYTNPTIHATADDLPVADYNAVANNTTFLYQKPYCNYYNNSLSSLVNGTLTQVSLGGTSFSGYGFSVVSNNVIVPLTGIYSVSWAILAVGPAGSTTTYLQADLYQGGTLVATGSTSPTDLAFPGSGGATLVDCSAGTTFGLWGLQTSGTGMSVQAGASYTYLSMSFVGSA